MRKEQVPDDMSSEIKTIFGMVSIRQVIYIAIAGLLIYAYIPIIFSLLDSINIWIRLSICIISAVPTLAICALLAFYKRRDMFFDRYLLIKLQAKKQRGSWYKTLMEERRESM